ncbi:ATP-binding protein [Sphingomonas nostoxanthinifaciens]|uniref:ATP-binding protein n=1 Tax=Sphingomonas nostoxanthinifaciens TaxID=2872652 RepID=UPI001CC1EF31|nr:ATP-binding protein [Sphingomonas nostoxanthinifaciens]UAK25764.1 response regulator [Sphingomonas nostoxanthinifaciens]
MGIDNHRTAGGNKDASAFLIDSSERLAAARSMDEVVEVLRRTARDAVGAEGIAVVIRDEGKCFYAAEDAVAPLWAGSRFDENSCISGWAMQHLETVAIRDVRNDERVPQQAYAPTFVRSLLMAPIGRPTAVAALGAYWSDVREHDLETIRRLESLARFATIAIENGRLLRLAEENGRQRELMVEAGRMGMWSFAIASGELETSDKCRLNFGRDPTLPFSYGDLRAAIHDDDKARVEAAIETSIRTGCAYDIEYRLITPDGETRWIGIRAKPSYTADGAPVSLAGLSIDITDRKRMEEALQSSAATLEHLVEERTRELIAAQEALRQAQKLEAMGQLTGGVAHDFNNLLTPIIGSLDLLQRRKVGGEREQRMIDGALQSADRARTLVQRLLAFARRQPLKPEPIDAYALVTGMSSLVETTLGPLVTLELDLAEGLPLAIADPHQIEMAILNLSVNARDAMPDGGCLVVSARRRNPGRDHPDVAEGSYVVISVADTGTGMDDETRRRAVEPFYSTKGVGQGTGLGLSMAHGLASQLGGALTIESSLGSGSTISLWLPISADTAVRAISFALQESPVAGVALLVDDEDLVRASTADMLIDMGFEVIEAGSGPEALQRLRERGGADVLITDHLMPKMTGVELAKAVAVDWPQMPVLVVSGYSDAIGIDAELPRLEKPFRQADLASGLAALLTKTAPIQTKTSAVSAAG